MAVCTLAVQAQSPPISILVVDTANRVNYQFDSFNVPKFGTSASIAAPQGIRTNHPFLEETIVADVASVNGKPAKGNMVIKSTASLNLSPIPAAGRAIGDITRMSFGHSAWEILSVDGQQVGTIITIWLSGGTPPPGAPSACTGGNQAIVGGTGAYLGVSGFVCQAPPPVSVTVRAASVQEDPQNRRINGGGTNRYIMQLIPRYVPEVVVQAGQPAILHADFSPVTATSPARSGESLILMAAGLGPTVPTLEPGDSFKQDPLNQVASPVEVIVNDQSVPTINSIGSPGTADRFRIDFKMPDGVAAGSATIQLSSAWIKCPTVTVPIR